MTAALKDMQLVLLGCGQMGGALLRGLIAAALISPARVYCIDADPTRAAQLAHDTGAQLSSYTLLAQLTGPRLLLAATKPGYIRAALEAAQPTADDIVVSVAAGVTLAALADAAPGAAVVRSMPNTPSMVGAGITGVMASDPDALAVATQLFEAVGEVVVLASEAQFDALTAVSGSGPAFMFVILEALADGGVLAGLDRITARKLARATMAGAAALAAADPTCHTAELKDRVASPGGTTIAGLEALEAAGLRHALISAVRAAARLK